MKMMLITCRVPRTRSVDAHAISLQLLTDTQDYGFDYSDDGEADEGGDTDNENMYYTAKCMFIVLFIWIHYKPITVSSQRRKKIAPKRH